MHHRLGCLPAGGLNRLSLKGKKKKGVQVCLGSSVSLEGGFSDLLCLPAGTSLVLGKEAPSHREFLENYCVRMEAVSGSSVGRKINGLTVSENKPLFPSASTDGDSPFFACKEKPLCTQEWGNP